MPPRPWSPSADTRGLRGALAAWMLAALLFYTGSLHFVSPTGFESIVPPFLGAPAFWVYASGVAEIGCAVALAIPRLRHVGALAAAALFVIVFPANVQMALDSGGADPDLFHNPFVAWGRLPLQIPLIAWAVFVSRRAPASSAGARVPTRPASPDPNSAHPHDQQSRDGAQ
ncbi:MAG: hypothetical protein ABR604_02500 [Jatrophihabitantaceae bacterium]